MQSLTPTPTCSTAARVSRAGVFLVAIAFSTFQVVTAAFSPLSSTVVRAVHVGFLLLMTFLLMPPFGRRWLGWIIGGIGFVASFYHWIFEADLIQRAGELTTSDMVIGSPHDRAGVRGCATRHGHRVTADLRCLSASTACSASTCRRR